MIKKNIIVKVILFSFLFSDCPDGFEEINNQCFWTNDLIVLQKFIINSNLSLNPLELGVQQWENGRLVSLCSSIYTIDGCQQSYQLSGSIPDEISYLDELRDLRLLGNELNGHIPTNFGELTNLEYLDLSYNNLNGEIPNSFGNLINLTDLYLSQNNLNGEIPDKFCDLYNLKNFYAFSNLLNGELPNCIGNLSELVILNLFDNKFNGSVPSSISYLNNLTYLDISNNNIETLPQSIGGISTLSYLHLNNNEIIYLPDEICNLNLDWSFPVISSIHSNYLCQSGYYPDCLEENLGQQYCSWFILGDTDLNGVVNIIDVVRLIAFILETESISEFEFIVSDIYQDYSLDILDINLLIEFVLD